MDGEARFVFPVVMTAMMGFVVTLLVTVTNLGVRSGSLAGSPAGSLRPSTGNPDLSEKANHAPDRNLGLLLYGDTGSNDFKGFGPMPGSRKRYF